MAILKAGTKFKSAVCDTEVIVIRAPAADIELHCGGAAMLPPAAAKNGAAADPAKAGGTAIGKRYVDEGETIELLCTKPGKGSLAVNGQLLGVKQARQLPSSD
jgi:hypothetical protein